MIVADLSFGDSEHEKLCADQAYAQRKFGKPGAKKLQRRVKELQTSPDRETLLQGPGGWHDILHDWPGHLSGTVTGGDRIVVRLSTADDGSTVWHVACIGDCYKH